MSRNQRSLGAATPKIVRQYSTLNSVQNDGSRRRIVKMEIECELERKLEVFMMGEYSISLAQLLTRTRHWQMIWPRISSRTVAA